MATTTPIHDHDTWVKALERFLDWSTFLDLSPSEAFSKASDIFSSEHFGVESITLEGTHDDTAAASMKYLNMGDTYDTTLILTDDYTNYVKPLIISSWGDWYEEAENQYNEEYGTIRCPYCSHLTPKADSYTDTVCESCNHLYS